MLAVARWIEENPPNISGMWVTQEFLSHDRLNEMAVLALFRALSSNQHLAVFHLQLNSNACACNVAQLWECLADNYTLEDVLYHHGALNAKREKFRRICTRNLLHKNQRRFKSVKAIATDSIIQ